MEYKRLLKDTRKVQQKAYANSTYNAYRRHWKLFKSFKLYFGLAKIIDIEQLCAFAVYVSYRVKTVESVRQYLQGVHAIAELKGKNCPLITERKIKLTLKGIKRNLKHRPRQAEAMDVHLLKEIHDILDLSDPKTATLWAAMIMGFFLLLRKSNLVPDTVKNFDPDKQLLRKDVACEKDVLLVKVRWSKTIQFQQKVLKVPLVRIKGSKICPVKAYQNMVKQNPTKDGEAPLFGVRYKKSVVPISYRTFNRFIKKAVELVGRKSDRFSTHSLRRGGATHAMNSKVKSNLIAILGDWASDCYKRYIDWSLDMRLSAAMNMSKKC